MTDDLLSRCVRVLGSAGSAGTLIKRSPQHAASATTVAPTFLKLGAVGARVTALAGEAELAAAGAPS